MNSSLGTFHLFIGCNQTVHPVDVYFLDNFFSSLVQCLKKEPLAWKEYPNFVLSKDEVVTIMKKIRGYI